jgi:predicted transposase YdaD
MLFEQARIDGHAQGLNEGRVEGREEGMAEGREKGRALGMAQGHEEGLNEGKLKIAGKMKKAGRSLNEIAEFTELSLETIEQLN